MEDYSNAYWEDYYGQDVAQFDKLSYVARNGERVWVDIEPDVENQISELQRTVGSNIEIRLYKTA